MFAKEDLAMVSSSASVFLYTFWNALSRPYTRLYRKIIVMVLVINIVLITVYFYYSKFIFFVLGFMHYITCLNKIQKMFY